VLKVSKASIVQGSRASRFDLLRTLESTSELHHSRQLFKYQSWKMEAEQQSKTSGTPVGQTHARQQGRVRAPARSFSFGFDMYGYLTLGLVLCMAVYFFGNPTRELLCDRPSCSTLLPQQIPQTSLSPPLPQDQPILNHLQNRNNPSPCRPPSARKFPSLFALISAVLRACCSSVTPPSALPIILPRHLRRPQTDTATASLPSSPMASRYAFFPSFSLSSPY
jgi:hypothetical protein